MSLRKGALLNAPLFMLLFCAEIIFAQQSKFNLSFSGGINIPKMDDINNIYHQGLDGYNDINFTIDLSTDFMYHFIPAFSLKLGFNYLFHRQNPPVELVNDDDETGEGSGRYRINAYCPFIGINYNKSIGSHYYFSSGLNLIYCMAKLNDELPQADIFFDILHGHSWGILIESNLRRRISNHLDIGLELGYRFLNIEKLKIDSSRYNEYSKDIEYTHDGQTIDLNFSGPLIRLLIIFKI